MVMQSVFPMGTGQTSRLTNRTAVTGIMVRVASAVMANLVTATLQELVIHNWFILDRAPTGNDIPGPSIIFDGVSPWNYSVEHDRKKRFSVLKKWRERLTTGGTWTANSSCQVLPRAVSGKSFMWRPKKPVVTYWKNNATANYSDVESNALLWVMIVSSSIPQQTAANCTCNIYYDNTVYFKCL